MSNELLERIGLTKGKAIAIAVLGLIFVGVLVSNFMPEAPKASSDKRTASKKDRRSTTPRRQPVRSAPRSRSSTKKNQQTLVNRATLIWPEVRLEEVVKHDPFALPVALQPPVDEPKIQTTQGSQTEEIDKQAIQRERDRLEIARQEKLIRRKQQLERLRELQKSGVGITMVSPEAKVVTVGDKKLQVGDLLDGFRIVEIRPDGSVVVEID